MAHHHLVQSNRLPVRTLPRSRRAQSFVASRSEYQISSNYYLWTILVLTVKGSRTRTRDAQLPAAARGRPNSAAGNSNTVGSTFDPAASYIRQSSSIVNAGRTDLFRDDTFRRCWTICSVITLDHVECTAVRVRDELSGSVR